MYNRFWKNKLFFIRCNMSYSHENLLLKLVMQFSFTYGVSRDLLYICLYISHQFIYCEFLILFILQTLLEYLAAYLWINCVIQLIAWMQWKHYKGMGFFFSLCFFCFCIKNINTHMMNKVVVKEISLGTQLHLESVNYRLHFKYSKERFNWFNMIANYMTN